MLWTFIIQYGQNELDMQMATAQNYNIVAMVFYASGCFICTYLLKYFNPTVFLMNMAIGAGIFTLGTIFLQGMPGIYSLVAISACMSMMFPTIYGIALKGLGEDAKLGSAGLILAIGGGSLLPPVQGFLIDVANWFPGFLSSTRISFVLPFICFIFIALYARWVNKGLMNETMIKNHSKVF